MFRWKLLRRIGMVGTGAALVVAPHPSHAQTCSWVSSVTEWHGSLSWSWNHQAAWTDSEGYAYTTKTTDAGTSTFDLDSAGFGYATGQLLYDELSTDTSPPPQRVKSTTHWALGWPALPTPTMDLNVDPFTCTYDWNQVVAATGTVATESGTAPVFGKQPNLIVHALDGYPIPNQPGPLSLSIDMPVRIPGTGTPFPLFVTGSGSALDSSEDLGQEQLGNAQVSWSFQPGELVAPLNDLCANASLLLAGALQDNTAATSTATDPVSTCGTGDRSTWFRYVPLFSGTAQISTAGSGYQTIVSVWPESEGCPALETEVGCGASIPMQAQTAYLIQVQRASGAGGNLAISVVPEPESSLVTEAAVLALALVRTSRRGRPAPRT